MSDQAAPLVEDEDIIHWQKLIFEHTRYLRIIERQIAGHGRLNAPPNLLRNEEIVRKEIQEVNQNIRRRIKHMSGDGSLYSDEEVDIVIDQLLDIHAIEMRHDSLIATREEYKRLVKSGKLTIAIYMRDIAGKVFHAVISFLVFIAVIFNIIETSLFDKWILIVVWLLICLVAVFILIKTLQNFNEENKKLKKNNANLADVLKHTAKVYEQIAEMKLGLSAIYKRENKKVKRIR